MGFSTPATRHEDIPIIDTQPKELPPGKGIPMEPFRKPVREPVCIPVRREGR